MPVFRLLADTRLISYNLNIRPDYEHFTDSVNYDGEVEIVFTSKTTMPSVKLNYKNLNVHVVYVREKVSGQSVNVTNVFYDKANEQLVIKLTTPLHENIEYAMNIKYKGNIRNAMNGIYKNTFNYDNYKE